MCIATPETVLSIEELATGPVGTILHAGRVISVDLSLVPEAKVGDTILFFRGNALRVIEETEARKIRAALSALADVMDGKASPDDIETIYKAIMKSDDDKVMYVKGVYPTGKQAFYAISLGD